MEKLDRFSAVFWLVISVAVCIHSVRLGLGTFHNPGVGFLFFWSGVVLGTLSIVLLVKAIHTQKKIKEKIQKRDFGERVNWLKVVLVLVVLVIYGLILERIGFLISTIFFIGFLLRAIEVKKWYTVAFVSLVSTFLVYGLFKILLQVRLPTGIFGL